MGFHEVQFPPSISFGSSGGPGFSTAIITTDSGAEQRVARWSQSRRKYDVSKGVKSQQDLSDLITFYIARQGPAFGFRFKDWSDYNTTTSGSYPQDGGQTNLDVNIGVGNGTKTQFQLLKNYSSGGITRVRKIVKPVAGTVKVALASVNQTAGWTVDTTTGLLTFMTAPAAGVVVQAGFEFDTQVRFGEALDDHLPIKFDDFNTGSVDIPLVEILDTAEQPDEYFYGGAAEALVTSDYQLSASFARVYIFNCTTASSLFLPNTANLPPGAPYFYLVNDSVSTQSLTVKAFGGTTVLATIAPGAVLTTILSIDGSSLKVWYLY